MKNSSDNTCNLHLYFIYPHITHKKFALKKRLLKVSLNGGLNVSKSELFRNYYEYLNDTPIVQNMCNLIS